MTEHHVCYLLILISRLGLMVPRSCERLSIPRQVRIRVERDSWPLLDIVGSKPVSNKIQHRSSPLQLELQAYALS